MADVVDNGDFELAVSTSHLLHRAQQLASDRFAELGGEKNGVTFRQFAVLAAVSKSPGVSQADLVRATGIDRSTLADMIRRMEKRGWIARATSASDKRAQTVNLSADGAHTLSSVRHQARAADVYILDALGGSKREFIKALEKLAKFRERKLAKAEEEARQEAQKKAKEKARAAAKEKKAKDKEKRKGKRRQRATQQKRKQRSA